ncbi:MAG: hypothetical protein JNK45_37640 [Myxococcales bacterium]|nr:hypothetical protein [Myxococcales bacterium]
MAEPPRAGAPTVVLRFSSLDAVEIRGETTRTHPLAFDGPNAAVSLADVAGTHAVVPLAAIVEDPAPQRFAVEATPVCPSPWIVDVAAPWLVARTAVTAAPAVLRAGCGPLQHTDFITGFGRERVLVYGAAPFDPRMVASEMGIVRSDLERMFEVRIDALWINEIAVVPHGGVGGPVAEPSPTGLRMRLDAAASWDAEARLEVGATIARIWLGKLVGQIAPAEPEGAAVPERAALLHGIGRGIARESLFELGLLSPDEYAADLDRAEALVAERSAAWRPAGAIDARDVAARSADASIDAAMLAWRMREADPPRSLPQVLEASSDGSEDLAGLWRRIAGGARPRKLGACVLQRATKTSVVDLGVSTPWEPTRSAAVVTSMREDGVGAAAGVATGDELAGVVATRDGTVVTVRRRGAAVLLTSTARPDVLVRRGWVRRANVADERCYPKL